jgi:Holliday junction resolvase RusA-like endonuclease
MLAEWLISVEGVIRTKERPRVGAQGQVYTTRTTREYEMEVAASALGAGVRWLDGFVFELTFKLWVPDRRSKDWDNIDKIWLDGLQRAGRLTLPVDDIFHIPVKHLHLTGIDKIRPRVELKISRRPAVGCEAGAT